MKSFPFLILKDKNNHNNNNNKNNNNNNHNIKKTIFFGEKNEG